MAQLSITTTRTTTTTTTTTTTITTSTHHFSSLLLSYLLLSCSFVVSNPLYFSYFVFFSPYILRILSFLSPLFVTTSLFLLAFLTLHKDHLQSKVGVLLGSLNAFGCNLDEDNVQKFRLLEELEACMVVLDDHPHNYSFSDFTSKELACNLEDKKEESSENEPGEAITLQELSHSESQLGNHPLINKPLTNDEEQKANEQQPLIISNVKEKKKNFEMSCDVKDDNKKNVEMSCSTAIMPCGSMRKENEWKRTLACKLYEERHNKYGSEGMDSLWEEYEADSGKIKKSGKEKNNETAKKEYGEEEEEDDEIDVKICCLQALKLSTGRMNMGMKKPNLLKISKALKGIGWLHSVSKLGKEKVKAK